MTTTTDGAALLAAVLARPADDTPRLVYADWLDDHDGAVTCPSCEGTGWTTREKAVVYGLESPVLIPDFATVGCPKCDGRRDRRGRGWAPSGAAGRAEFIRVQCDAASGKPFEIMRLWELLHHSAEWFPGVCRAFRFDTRNWGVMSNGSIHYESKHTDGEFFVRRGFVDELRVPTLATLFGGECENCGGSGRVDGDRYEQSQPCPDCGGEYGPPDEDNPTGVCPGTGRTPGIAAAVWGAHPVTRVVVGDREPSGIDRAGVSWWRESAPRNPMSGVRESARVPDAVYEHLERSATAFTIGRCTYHAGRDAALAALSDAIVAHGRALAGLK